MSRKGEVGVASEKGSNTKPYFNYHLSYRRCLHRYRPQVPGQMPAMPPAAPQNNSTRLFKLRLSMPFRASTKQQLLSLQSAGYEKGALRLCSGSAVVWMVTGIPRYRPQVVCALHSFPTRSDGSGVEEKAGERSNWLAQPIILTATNTNMV